jgi:tetratricopeptide (TPR) repeat protein
MLPEVQDDVAQTYWVMRRWDEAEAAFVKLLELSPEYSGAHMRLGRVYLDRGEPERALEQMLLEDPGVYGSFGLALAYNALGDDGKARDELDRMIREQADVGAYQIAEIHGQFGDADAAFEWLERARVLGDSGLGSLLGDPAFDSLLNDTRWHEFLQRMNLHEAWLAMPAEWGGPQS